MASFFPLVFQSAPVKRCLHIHANCRSCTFDEIKFYILLVTVQLRWTFPSKSQVQHDKTACDTIVTQHRWGWQGKLSATPRKRESLPKGCMPPESKLRGRQATASNQACPADGPRRDGCHLRSQAGAREAGLLCGVEQVRSSSPRRAVRAVANGLLSLSISCSFFEQLNSRCWILAASCVFICFNLISCRSERVLTEIIIPLMILATHHSRSRRSRPRASNSCSRSRRMMSRTNESTTMVVFRISNLWWKNSKQETNI